MFTRVLVALAWVALACFSRTASAADQPNVGIYDVVVYGGTSAGVIAAVQARRWAGRRSLSARTSTWAACPAAGWAGPIRATRR